MKVALICLGIYIILPLLSVLRAIYATRLSNKVNINDLPFVRGLRSFHTAVTRAVDVSRNPFQSDIDKYNELSEIVDTIDSSNPE